MIYQEVPRKFLKGLTIMPDKGFGSKVGYFVKSNIKPTVGGFRRKGVKK